MAEALYLTPTRAQLLQDVRDGELYFEANEWWGVAGYKRTAAIGQLCQAGWATNEKATPETKRPGELVGRIYARLTDEGRSVLEEWESRNG